MRFDAGRERFDGMVALAAVVAVVAISVAATARRRVARRMPLLDRL
jgi:hypothetical protein